mmetsp:Transcript_12568/g.14287  ORF Transcript_12568/g.14287 Transcript_12568/m.14287 type:complete len:217 (+) Transcript_12568:32-682(+)
MSSQQSSNPLIDESLSPRTCGNCGANDCSLKLCTACRLVYYCGRDCQVAHRSVHKKICKKQQSKLKDKCDRVDRVDSNNGANNKGKEMDSSGGSSHGNINLDQPVIIFIVKKFVSSQMSYLLGGGDEATNDILWDALFHKKGAKKRVHEHMMSFAILYLSNHTEYGADDTIAWLLQLDYMLADTIRKEPFLSSMRDELHDYLRTVEHFFEPEIKDC